ERSVSMRHPDRISLSRRASSPPFPSERVQFGGITQPPPSVIFQPTADPAEDTNSFLEEVAGAFDNAFETACSTNTELNVSTKETMQDEQAEAAVQDLFVQIAASYAIPLKSFIFELQRGTASKDEIELCRPILHSICKAVEVINLPQTVQRINDLDAALALGLSSGDRLLKGEIRHRILSSYEALMGTMPEAFRLGDEGQKR